MIEKLEIAKSKEFLESDMVKRVVELLNAVKAAAAEVAAVIVAAAAEVAAVAAAMEAVAAAAVAVAKSQ